MSGRMETGNRNPVCIG